MGKFSSAAKRVANVSHIMAGREKISTNDIIAVYPNGITVNGADMVTYQGVEYPVFTYVEDDSKFFSGGIALTAIVNAWLEMCNGDINEVDSGLREENVKIKLVKVKTSNGRNFVKAEIIDE